MLNSTEWEVGIEGNFPINKAIIQGRDTPHRAIDWLKLTPTSQVMPRGTRVVSAESCGISAWTKIAKVSVILADGTPKRYFLKVDLPSSC
jgi:protein-ribulosamine 3-kinase